jgi:hypothetical protein
MNRKLIYSNDLVINEITDYYNELAERQNVLLKISNDLQLASNQITSSEQAFKFAANPSGYTMSNGQPGSLAEFRNQLNSSVNNGFRRDYKHIPGRSPNLQAGNLQDQDKDFIRFDNGEFSVNKDKVNELCEKYRKYATTDSQFAVVTYFETLVDVLNAHPMRPTDNNCLNIAELLKIDFDGQNYQVDSRKLAKML